MARTTRHPGRWALIGLATAVALLAAGLWIDRPAAATSPRVVMIGVPRSPGRRSPTVCARAASPL